MGFEDDISPIAEVDVDGCAPILKDAAYVWADQSAGRSADTEGDPT